MQWNGVCLVPETRSSLEQRGGEVQVSREELLTFYLTDAVVPDPERHPFFTGRGATAELAEQAAYTVYLRAQHCTHVFQTQDVGMLSCRTCGVRMRALPKGLSGNSSEASGWWSKLKNFF